MHNINYYAPAMSGPCMLGALCTEGLAALYLSISSLSLTLALRLTCFRVLVKQ